MPMLRSLAAPLLAFALAALSTLGAAQAQNKITIGKVLSGNGFHIPTYVAMSRGFYKAEGLDASFVSLTGRALVTAALAGSIDFVPIPSGGAQAALSGAEIRYVVGESLKSQWLIAVRPNINKPEELRGKTIGYGRAGAADYDEGAAVMRRAFKMEVGKDYKVISFQGETERIAALVNGDIAAALISVPHAPKALNAGMKILVHTGDYIQRAGGTIWTRKAFADQHPDVLPKFVRAIA
jgi:NitT/TauT family transport system substrate-binding protein